MTTDVLVFAGPAILYAQLCFNMVDALRAAGGNVVTTAVDFEPNVIEDCELIIGRNPRSPATPILSSTNNDRSWREAVVRGLGRFGGRKLDLFHST